ncbi:MAG: FdtA/QdtA family cupin domain-containing protein [Clostridiaceae bacterium]
MYNYCLLKFENIVNNYGSLVPIEQNEDIPFNLKRIYYIFNVEDGITRGHHAHRKLQQVLICISGSVKIRLKTPKSEESIELNDPSIGLFIGTMVWGEMYDFSKGAVLLVLASGEYDESDYIRNYDFYIEESKNRY